MGTLAAVVSGLVILCIGCGIGYYFGRMGQSATDARLEEIEEEYEKYRADVAEHFGKTADQFHAIGLQYRELYEHLAAGSAALCELEPPAGKAPFPPAIEQQEGSAAAESAEEAPAESTVAEEAAATLATDAPESDSATETASLDESAPDEAPDAAQVKPDNVVELVRRPDSEAEDETDPDERNYS